MGSLVRRAASGEPLLPQTADRQPLSWKIDPYRGEARYDAVRRWCEGWKGDTGGDLSRKRTRLGDPILKTLETARLRGMGGACFPTSRKWSTVRQASDNPKYIVCNGDESEPGTFKDRELLHRAPYLVIEGMTIAALVTGAERGYIYIRHEFKEEIEAVREAIMAAAANGVCGPKILDTNLAFELEVFVSPGGYICGEESALLEAIEDRRAEPRNKPPFPVFEGLYGKPTVINNVETLSWVPAILEHGGPWYRDLGANGATGLRLVSISGDVRRPGVYEVPFGQTVRELVFDTAGGMEGGQALKAIAPSGPSGGFLPPHAKVCELPPAFVRGLVERKILAPNAESFNFLDLPLDPDVLKPFPDLMLGAAFVVYGAQADMVHEALNCVEFYRNESCGKCVPCRLGTEKLAQLIENLIQGREGWNLNLVDELAASMFSAAICGLGQVAANPITSVIKYFRQDLENYVARNGRI